MSATSYVVALALLNGPPDAPVPPVAFEEWPAVRTSVAGLATEWELLDKREDRLTCYENFAIDIAELRRRRRDLAEAPRIADAQRFPPREITEDLIRFNRAYRTNLECQRRQEPGRAELNEALRETDQLFHVWDSVRDARCEVYYLPMRRAALQRLKTLIGPEAYYSGQLPPHVPVWRFAEIK